MEKPHQYTHELAVYLHNLNAASFSIHTFNSVKMCIQDFIGVAIAGSNKMEAEIWRKYYETKMSVPQAALFAPGFMNVSVEQAAALNAVFGHVMDMDDVHNASITHLGAITIPTAFALGQSLGKSGTEVMEAVVAGYEAGARIGEAINPSSYKYWHTTGVVGTFASGTCAAKLLNLSVKELEDCLGSAGTQASGLWEFLSSGSMSKVLHTANANLCGLRAAELAKLGFTGSGSILEGERGFVKAIAPEYNLECLVSGFYQGYRIEKISFKSYACCRHTHSANYCIEKILASHDFVPEAIESIIDDTYSVANQITNNPYPSNPYMAKFSLQFCIAAAIIFKDLKDCVFTDENIKNPQIRSIMDKIRVNVNQQLDKEFRQNPNQWSHHLTIRLKTGQVIQERVDYPIGDFHNPFDWTMADNKFRLLVEGKLDKTTIEVLLHRLHHLETLENINQLFVLL